MKKYKLPRISKKKINYCKEGNFFWVKWKEDPTDNYELIQSCHLFDEVVHFLQKQGFEVTE
tara:strand:- start:281 stop:463 length:183 start_codon:yes stop_codon:yes gene_type:complete